MPKKTRISQADIIKWIYGGMATFIGGGASAVVTGVTVNLVDPKDFAMASAQFQTVVLISFLAHGIINLAMYLQKQPLPALTEVETSVQTVTEPVEGVTVTKTVKETRVEEVGPVPPANPSQSISKKENF